ncbi:MAG TPA: F0F1 ATP synthase subunit delta [Arenimonas sp.]|nr:F0F1 ATP synthase subunit delta [Arenimonas sp.]
MSQAITLARPYARALFLLAKEAGQLKDVSEALGFSAHASVVPAVAELIGNPRASNAQLIDLVSHPEAPAVMHNFLSVLAENGRLGLLPDVSALFEQLRAESEHVVKANITSAAALSDAELRQLTDALKKRFGREVDVQTSVDASLIGGAVIDTGDVVIDGSIRNKLSRLNASLAN